MLQYRCMSYIVIGAVLVGPVAGQAPRPANAERPQTGRGELISPRLFVQNLGQWPDAVRFQMRRGNQTWWFTDDGIWLTVIRAADAQNSADRGSASPDVLPGRGSAVQGVNLRITVDDMSSVAHLVPAAPQSTHVNYFRGSNPEKWHANVPTFSSLVWHDIFPGVDLAFGDTWQLISNLVRSPAKRALGRPLGPSPISSARTPDPLRDPRRGKGVNLHIDGADRLRVDENGRLVVETAVGEIVVPAFTDADNRLLTTAISDDSVSLSFPCLFVSVSPCLPVLLNSSVPQFPVSPSPCPPVSLSPCLLVSPAGDPSDLLYSTYLGGAYCQETFETACASQLGSNLVVGPDGSTYVTGATNETDFPTTPGAFQIHFHPNPFCGLQPEFYECTDVFVTKLNGNGTGLVYSTYLGGAEDDIGLGLALALDGSIFVTGFTASANFPTTLGAYDTIIDPTMCVDVHCGDAFITYLNADGTALLFSTYLGGNGVECHQDCPVAIDEDGGVYLSGETTSSDFPTTPGAYQTTNHGLVDTFVAQLTPDGSGLVYSTYLGGSNSDESRGLALGPDHSAYLAGLTTSPDFPTTPLAYDTTCGDNGACDPDMYGQPQNDAFVVHLSADGGTLWYATYVGGGAADDAQALALAGDGSAYIAGSTFSTDFPTTSGAYDTTCGCVDGSDAFVTVLNATGMNLVYSTFLGGADWDTGVSIALRDDGTALVTGYTYSTNFPITPGAYRSACNSNDVFLARLNAAGSGLAYSTCVGPGRPAVVAVDHSGLAYLAGSTTYSTYPTTPGAYDTSLDNYGDIYISKLNPVDPIGTLRGSILDASSGQPVVGATVTTVDEDTRQTYTRITDEHGQYNFSVVPGVLALHARAFYYQSRTIRRVSVATGQVVTRNIPLSPAPTYTVQGQVVDRVSGQPVSATIRFSNGPVAHTDDQGRYSVALPAGRYAVSAEPRLRCLANGRATITVPPAQTLDFPLFPEFDAGGYGCSDRQDRAWIMPDTPIALAGDNAVVTVTLPFPFPFYGQTYDQVHVSTNGNIHFGPANPSWTTYCLPNANIPRAMIAPFLDDLYVDSVGQIAQATVGVAPHRTWVVQWTNIRLQYELASRVTFQIQLSEGTGDIWTLYGPLSGFSGGGRLASVGIQDQTGTVGTQYSCADAVLHPTLTVHYGHR